MTAKLHHIGYVVEKITTFEKNIIYDKKIKEITDPIQQAKLCLYSAGENVYIELIEPLSESAYTYNFLKKARTTNYHHLCYEVDNEEIMLKIAKELRLLNILGPIPAILFDQQDVYFFYSRNKEIIEFLIANK